LPMSTLWTSTREPLLSVVIPVRNDAGNLARCIEALQGQPASATIEIIVADNGSTDSSREVARSLGATVLRIPDVPVSTLRNTGMRLARAPLVAFIDADNVVSAGWLAAVSPHFVNARVAAVGRDYSSPAAGTWVQQVYDSFRHHSLAVEEVRWLATGNIAVRRSAALAIGGFDETLETSEDFDFCNRLRRGGDRILSDPRLESIHFGDPRTLADLFKSELWRGRDTLRVGLRGMSSWSELPSVLFPLITLTSITVGLVSVALAWPLGRSLLWWTGGSLGVVLTLSSLRAARMLSRVRTRSLATFAAMWTVASVYDVARAFALVVRMPHRGSTASHKRSQVVA
jgi:GT2 family glycosyltransferase